MRDDEWCTIMKRERSSRVELSEFMHKGMGYGYKFQPRV